MKPIRCLAAFLAAWVLWSAALMGVGAKGGADEPVSTSSAPAASMPGVDLKLVRDKAFRHLLAGEFGRGLVLLESPAGKMAGAAAAEARTLTAQYLESLAQADAERQSELSRARKRVRLARLAEDYRPKLMEAGLDEKLYEALEAVADAVQAANGVLEVRPTTQPADMRKTVAEHIERAREQLLAVRELLGDGHDRWGQAFRDGADQLDRALSAYPDAWARATLPADWRMLKLAGQQVQDALIDLGVLAARRPLMIALSHAREAKELSGNSEDFLKQQWVRELVQQTQQYGAELVKQCQWSDALSVYGSAGLSGLDEDNLAYKEVLKRIIRHVQVISLYGRGGAAELAKTQPAGDGAPAGTSRPADDPRWREMVVGIDTAMVRNIISNVGEGYVERPDYRKLGIAALAGVRVLVETPEAAKALPSLRRAEARAKFLSGVEKLIVRLQDAATVDHLDVTLALNVLHEINYDTLELPSEVIDKEFAEAMVAELDQFSWVVWPYEAVDFDKRIKGTFSGIGVQISKQAGEPIEVVTPLADAPAYRAGIRAGDYILKVDGRSTMDIPLARAVKFIMGPRGTKVTLAIRRSGVSKPFDVGIVRDTIHIRTVKGWRRLPDGKWDYLLDPQRRIAYVCVTQFTEDTPVEISQAMESIRSGGVESLILDLRSNPGGVLKEAVEVIDEFLARGLLIVRTKTRSGGSIDNKAVKAGDYERGELVVLANQYSASAAEIAAGALKEWGRARVVGTRTYGKGSVQRVIRLQSNSQAKLKLTMAYYYLPSGRCLHRTNGAKYWGVDPHLPVPVTVRQMNRWAEIRQETDLFKAVEPKLLDDLLAQRLREDLQLRTALLLLRLKLVAQGA